MYPQISLFCLFLLLSSFFLSIYQCIHKSHCFVCFFFFFLSSFFLSINVSTNLTVLSVSSSFFFLSFYLSMYPQISLFCLFLLLLSSFFLSIYQCIHKSHSSFFF